MPRLFLSKKAFSYGLHAGLHSMLTHPQKAPALRLLHNDPERKEHINGKKIIHLGIRYRRAS